MPKKKLEKSVLSEFIANRRLELDGMSQKQLAELTGVNLGTIASIESGQSKLPRKETLDKIADGLRIDRMHLWLLATSAETFDNSTVTDHLDGLIFGLIKVHKVPAEVANLIKMQIETTIHHYDPKRTNYKRKAIPREGLQGDIPQRLEFQEFCEQEFPEEAK